MTAREFFTTIAEVNQDNAEIVAFAKAELAKLDKRNEARRNTPTKTQTENKKVKFDILAFLQGREPTLANEIATACDITTQKASALCAQLAEEGLIAKFDVKIKNKGKCKAYTLNEDSGAGDDSDEGEEDAE